MISNNTLNRIAAIVGALMLLALTSACAKKSNLVEQGGVAVEIVPSPAGTDIVRADAYEEEGRLLLIGRVQAERVKVRGHVDVAILDQDGTVRDFLSIAHAKYQPSRYQALFSAQVPVVPSPGSVIRLAYHPFNDRTSGKVFDCGHNAVLSAAKTSR